MNNKQQQTKDIKATKQPKVLVGAPTFSGMRYCQENFIQSIKSLDYPNFAIYLIDNSDNLDYFNELIHLGVKVKHLKIKGSATQRLVESRNELIDYMLDQDYDYLLMLDSDVISPKNVIQSLLRHKKDIVSGLYYNLFDTPSGLKYQPVAYQFVSEEEFKKMQQINPFPPNVTHNDVKRKVWDEEIESGKLLEVKVPCGGCMLISRKVLEDGVRYSTYKTDLSKSGWAGDEMMFCQAAREKGYKLFLDPKVKCDHITKGKYLKDKGGYVHPLHDTKK